MCCCDATASSFVTRVCGEVFVHFHAVTIKCHSSMRNWLFHMPGWILCEQPTPLISKRIMNMVLTLLFTCLGEFGLPVYGSWFLPRMFL
jgi:hypothetical protein